MHKVSCCINHTDCNNNFNFCLLKSGIYLFFAKDLEKSYAAQKSLLQANQASEMESTEIQDFLQAEKTMLSDTIKELEKEVSGFYNTIKIV